MTAEKFKLLYVSPLLTGCCYYIYTYMWMRDIHMILTNILFWGCIKWGAMSRTLLKRHRQKCLRTFHKHLERNHTQKLLGLQTKNFLCWTWFKIFRTWFKYLDFTAAACVILLMFPTHFFFLFFFNSRHKAAILLPFRFKRTRFVVIKMHKILNFILYC